jgi:hypothetical protein
MDSRIKRGKGDKINQLLFAEKAESDECGIVGGWVKKFSKRRIEIYGGGIVHQGNGRFIHNYAPIHRLKIHENEAHAAILISVYPSADLRLHTFCTTEWKWTNAPLLGVRMETSDGGWLERGLPHWFKTQVAEAVGNKPEPTIAWG